MRREWIQRILDHDGYGDDAGGIEAWMQLGLAVGLSREETRDLRHVLPGVRFAVDAYVNFARRAPWQEAMCSSLTELFAPKIHKERLANWPEHYPWIETDRPAVFPQPRDAGAARRRAGAVGHARLLHDARGRRSARSTSCKFKLDILWAMNDAMALGYAGADLTAPPQRATCRASAAASACNGSRRSTAHVLLYPEGMVKLNAQRRRDPDALRRRDAASRRSSPISRQRFATTGLERDVLAFLDLAAEQRWVEWV